MQPDILIRRWIVEVIRAHASLVAIAVRQRAKFEGWLKFELAAYAELQGASDVKVEAGSAESGRARCDLTFEHNGGRCDVELKTCNTNWRMEGVLNLTRPLTKNIAEIVADARKLTMCQGEGIVAFCVFPVPTEDRRWTQYLTRIGNQVGIRLSVESHTDRVSVSLGGGCEADVVVVAFRVQKGPAALSLPNSALEPTAPA